MIAKVMEVRSGTTGRRFRDAPSLATRVRKSAQFSVNPNYGVFYASMRVSVGDYLTMLPCPVRWSADDL